MLIFTTLNFNDTEKLYDYIKTKMFTSIFFISSKLIKETVSHSINVYYE